MDVRIMNPEIIPYVVIVAILFLFAWKKKKKFGKGVIVANTGYVKNTGLYKSLKLKYIIYKVLIIIICFAAIIITTVLTARLYKEDKYEEEKEFYNRDIILCLDYSGSMNGIVRNIVDKYIEIVEKLKGDRFGIVVFGGAPSTILPLTDDYEYAISVLKRLNNSSSYSSNIIGKGAGSTVPNSYSETVWEWTGMRAYSCCSSSDGDGLAASVVNFDKDDNRTKVVVLAADHGVGSNYIVSLNDAAKLARNNNVKVYYVDGESNTTIFTAQGRKDSAEVQQEKIEAANITNGKYYDAHNMSVDQIVRDIDNLDKTLLVEKNVESVKTDLPELLFPYLLYLLPILFLLNWRVKI